MAIVHAWPRLGRRRGSEPVAALDEGDVLVAVPGRAPRDPVERFALGYLAKHGRTSRSALVAAVRGWIAQRERSTGGGVNDLGCWGDGLWHDEALRVVGRMEGGLISRIDRAV